MDTQTASAGKDSAGMSKKNKGRKKGAAAFSKQQNTQIAKMRENMQYVAVTGKGHQKVAGGRKAYAFRWK